MSKPRDRPFNKPIHRDFMPCLFVDTPKGPIMITVIAGFIAWRYAYTCGTHPNVPKSLDDVVKSSRPEKKNTLSINLNEQLCMRSDKATTPKARARRGLLRSDFQSETMKKAEEQFDAAVRCAKIQDRPRVYDLGLEDAVRQFNKRGLAF
ncbi:hypothetical protein EDC01DRAFT_775256 [Geopyxis carbonaria]|nr:hypothetical protein EDC01DRAFT_775256 [Geopyxis carbonaria]